MINQIMKYKLNTCIQQQTTIRITKQEAELTYIALSEDEEDNYVTYSSSNDDIYFTKPNSNK